jgi:hypothetical protein
LLLGLHLPPSPFLRTPLAKSSHCFLHSYPNTCDEPVTISILLKDKLRAESWTTPEILILMLCLTLNEHNRQKCPFTPELFVTINECVCVNEQCVLVSKQHGHRWERQIEMCP